MSANLLGLLVVVVCAVAIISRRLSLPYSVGLVIAGIVLARIGGQGALSVPPDLIYKVLLPPLIFEAAFQVDWKAFRADLPITGMLAFPGVLVAGALIAAGAHLILGWGWLGACVFGALISATDPVSVIAMFRALRLPPRLGLLVESESLLNDGSAAVAFAILIAIVNGQHPDAWAMARTLIWMSAGGVAVGCGVAAAALLAAGRTDDHLVEITLTTIAAYGSFLLAERLHASGVLAALAAGLVIGNVGWNGWMGCMLSTAGRAHVTSFWEYAAFLANSVVFILIGAHEAHQGGRLFTGSAAVAIGLVLCARVATVYPISALFRTTRLRVDLSHQHILVWGGLRGAMALALALAVPDALPEKSAIIICTFAVVAFSIFAQGLTMKSFIARFGTHERSRQ